MKKIIKYILPVFIAFTAAGIWQACSGDEDQTVGNPQVKSFTPAAGGPVGTYVVISGIFFSTTKENVVEFNGVKATIMSASSSTITTTVPAGAGSGPITVTVEGHQGSSASNFAVTAGIPTPVIFGMDPKTGLGADGTTVTITGLNFSTTAANNVVKFKDEDGDDLIAAVPTDVTSTSLKVKVPVGARSGKITLTVTGATGTATSDVDFAVPEPAISGFTPSFSIVGSTVIISGSNFSEVAANNIVMFNGVPVVPVDASSSSLTVIVPPGATSGKISVAVDGQEVMSEDDFEVN